MIARMAVSSPPGVFSSNTTNWACCAAASAIARVTCSALTACTVSSICTTSTGPLGRLAGFACPHRTAPRMSTPTSHAPHLVMMPTPVGRELRLHSLRGSIIGVLRQCRRHLLRGLLRVQAPHPDGCQPGVRLSELRVRGHRPRGGDRGKIPRGGVPSSLLGQPLSLAQRKLRALLLRQSRKPGLVELRYC